MESEKELIYLQIELENKFTNTDAEIRTRKDLEDLNKKLLLQLQVLPCPPPLSLPLFSSLLLFLASFCFPLTKYFQETKNSFEDRMEALQQSSEAEIRRRALSDEARERLQQEMDQLRCSLLFILFPLPFHLLFCSSVPLLPSTFSKLTNTFRQQYEEMRGEAELEQSKMKFQKEIEVKKKTFERRLGETRRRNSMTSIENSVDLSSESSMMVGPGMALYNDYSITIFVDGVIFARSNLRLIFIYFL